MGQVLYDFYLKADTIGGIPARTKLSILTKISSTEAKSMADSAHTISLFEKAFKTLSAEFTTKPLGFDDTFQKTKGSQLHTDSALYTAQILRKQLSLFTDLTAQRALFIHDRQATYKRITEAMVEAIEVERASIWLYNETKTGITCADLFIKKGQHSSGIFLAAKDFPRYFHAIQKERTLAAHNAHTDPSTSEFSASYLKPLGINSMLDVPIWINGQMKGVICLEHVGPMRTWTKDEENFAYLISNTIALILERQPEGVK